MKRKGVFIIILIVALCISAVSFFCDFSFCRQINSGQNEPGAFYFADDQSPYFLDAYLTCEWEYYPDQLLYSETEEQLVSGEIDDSDPAVMADNMRNHTPPQAETVDYTTELNPNAEHILLPAGVSAFDGKLFGGMPRSATYRLVLKNCPEIEDVDIVISLQGMTNGNYALFINGRKRSNIVAPFSYPAFYTSLDDEMEIVIETSNSQMPLNIIPRIAHKGTAMAAVDGYKLHFTAMAAALLIASVILMILVFAVEPSKFRWHFSIGFVFSLGLVALNVWVIGFLGTITKVLPTYTLSRIPPLLFLIGFFIYLFTLLRSYPEYYRRNVIQTAYILLAAAFTLELIDTVFPGTFLAAINGWACGALSAAAFIIWIIETIRSFSKNIPQDLFLFQIAILSLVCGSLCAIIYNLFGVLNFTLYIYPICLLIYLTTIFVSSKAAQKQLVNNTLKMLELEKENTKFQAAAISSKMQPHFLYNTLTSIQEMCYTEPEMAADMIVHLSQYLRKNIDLLDYNDTIPFSQELDHISDYLYIQKARYGNALNYEEFIGFRDFQIPPFSVQPLIENAINYGIRKNKGNGTVRLETYTDKGTIVIKVSNSGLGFDTSVIKPNHSIYNIRKRLEYLVNGSLEIVSHPESFGTTAKITIPLNDSRILSKESDSLQNLQ